MADTARSTAALLALFADNTAGAITAQDCRDLIVSLGYRPGGYVASETYYPGNDVIGSDGVLYKFVGPSPTAGDNPVGSTTGNWYGLARSGATPTSTSLAAPTNLAASPGNAQAALAWTGVSAATGYNVKRSTASGGPYTVTVASNISATSYTDAGLVNGTTYYYVVTAVNSSGESGASIQASCTPVASSVNYVTGITPASPRNNFSADLGAGMTIGSQNVTVTSLGRYVLTGNTQPHLLRLVLASDHSNVPNGSVTVNTSGSTANAFAYATLATPVTLLANTTYYLVSTETSGGDTWLDESQYTASAFIAIAQGQYYGGGTWTNNNNGGEQYVGVDLLFTVG